MTARRYPRARPPRPPGAVPQPGDRRTRRDGLVELYAPGHPLALRGGWVRLGRWEAYEARQGRCACDVGGMELQWRLTSVTPEGEVLCRFHSQTYRFGVMLKAAGRLVPELASHLDTLMTQPCWMPEGD